MEDGGDVGKEARAGDPGIGAFPFMWEIPRLLIGEWWGGQAEG